METALKIVPEIIEVETKALSVIDQAQTVKITDNETYLKAGEFWKTIKEMIKEVEDTFNPIVDAAFKAHRKATEQRAKFLDPLKNAYKGVKGLMDVWDRQQEEIRLAEQKRLEEIARKEEEERRILEAIQTEEQAKANGLTPQEAAQEAEAIISEPIYIPPVVLPKETPKVKGLSFREVWSAEVMSIKELCRGVSEGSVSPECVVGNMPVLNKMAMALKQTMNVRGVKAISRRV